MRWVLVIALLALSGCSAPEEGTPSKFVWSWCDDHGNRVYREMTHGNIFVLKGDCR